MEKVILRPEDCAQLVPHWYELNPIKLERLSKIGTRHNRKSYSKEKQLVMDVPPILIGPERYILNGKHRAAYAVKKGFALEACIISTMREIEHHTPKEAKGNLSVTELEECFYNRPTYIRLCEDNGVSNIADLVK